MSDVLPRASGQPVQAPSPTSNGPGPDRRLFVRQSSGLVRQVSVTNALFFNTAAFIGGGLGWYPVTYTLALVPIGVAGFTTYGWAALIVGAFCVVLALIFSSLTSAMPRSGGDYVFTSRLIPRVGPLLGWLESFTLVFASLAIIAFEVPVTLRNLQITGRIIGIGTGWGFFTAANGWFAKHGVITGLPGFLGALVVLGLVLVIVVQPTRRLHRIVTALAAFGLVCAGLMFVFGLLLGSSGAFAAHLPTLADGTTVRDLQQAASNNGVAGSGIDFAPAVFGLVSSVVIFNYIGFQYSAYIAGEVRGNVRRGILIAVLGALGIAVLLNSVYTDSLARHYGVGAQLGWGSMFWLGQAHLPLGQPGSLPLVAAIATPSAWPLWAFISLGATLFPLLLCPVYLNFISRVMLAWSLDRQVPTWFGEVNERLRAPLRALLTALGISLVLAVLQNFPLLPHSLAPPDGKLNLGATAWFSIALALLTWVMPGVNAIVGRFSRPDLLRSAPGGRALPFLGAVWLVFAVLLYWFGTIRPIKNALTTLGGKQSPLSYLNSSGLTFAIGIVVIGLVIFAGQSLFNRARGVDTALMFKEVPPE
jgi:basic amino acid/polyamine antiporter, APA family